MTYTIFSKRKDGYKWIYFAHPLCHSVRFGFVVHPKTGYCRAFVPGYESVKISKRQMKETIEGYKAFFDKYFGTVKAFDKDAKGK